MITNLSFKECFHLSSEPGGQSSGVRASEADPGVPVAQVEALADVLVEHGQVGKSGRKTNTHISPFWANVSGTAACWHLSWFFLECVCCCIYYWLGFFFWDRLLIYTIFFPSSQSWEAQLTWLPDPDARSLFPLNAFRPVACVWRSKQDFWWRNKHKNPPVNRKHAHTYSVGGEEVKRKRENKKPTDVSQHSRLLAAQVCQVLRFQAVRVDAVSIETVLQSQ